MAQAIENWMPLYWGDYLKKTARFTLAHHGAYLLLLGEYWTTGTAIPADPDEQALIVRIPTKEWLKLRPKIAEKFDERDGRWHHERVEKELAIARKRQAAKAKAGAEGAAKRWQKDSTAMAQPSVCQSQNDAPSPSPSPSPVGEKSSDDDLAKPVRAARISEFWKPNEKDFAYATAKGLDASTIANIAEQFRNHWLAKPKNNTSKNWSLNWRTWVQNHINYNGTGPWPRTGGSKPGQHGSRAGSVVDVVTRLKARADLGGQDDGTRMGGGGDELSPAEPYPANASIGDLHGGEILDAAECERMYRPARRTEASDRPANGGDGEPGGPTDAVCEEAPGLSGGRGEEGSDDAAEHQQMVAGMVGVEGEAGPVELQAPPSSGGLEEWEIIPEFLRRN